MDEERYELAKEYVTVDKKLEKEKGKRLLILILLYSVLCGFVFSVFIENILGLIFLSIISGFILCIISLFTPDAVTNSFTNITQLEARKKYLEEKLEINNKNNWRTL